MAVTHARVLIPSLLLALGASGAVAVPASADELASCSSFDTEVRQLIRPSSEVNLLTRWADEGTKAGNIYGFTQDEGVIADFAGAAGPGLSAVYRLYRDGDFTWATGSDADALVDQGYQRQFVDFYAADQSAGCLGGVYRLTRGKISRMATAADVDGLTDDGWTNKGVAFYAKTSGEQSGTEPAGGVDTKFSLAVLPDTQREFTASSDNRFVDRAQWLKENKSALDLRYAVQIGDLVNWGNADPAQFTKASADVKALEAVGPWAPVIGNHDTAAVCPGGAACPGTDAHREVRNTTAFNKAFPVSRFPNVKGTFEPNKIDNSYQIFEAGGVQWMTLSLELWPRKGVIDWAKGVIEANPDANVIVATHAYLNPDGSISGSNGGYGDTSPQYLFDNLIKVYPNIKMVLSGHVGTSAVRTDTGVNGNRIVSLLQCYHSSTNPVRLVEIDTKAGTVTSKVYAPGTGSYLTGDATSTSGMSFVKLG